MSEMNVAGVLAQIRALGAQAAVTPNRTAAPASSANSFESLFKQVIENTDGAQKDAARLQRAFEMGDSQADLPSVMLATAKAQVSFRALVEVRNRLVSAYQDVMNMPV